MNISTIVLPLHLLSLAFCVWNIVRADLLGMSWMKGRKETLDPKIVNKHHMQTWIGLWLMVVTGLTLFYPLREFLLSRPQFYLKMAFVLTLICNGFIIGHLQKLSETRRYASLTFKEKLPLYISGGLSTLSWVGAAATAFFLLPD